MANETQSHLRIPLKMLRQHLVHSLSPVPPPSARPFFVRMRICLPGANCRKKRLTYVKT